MAFCTDRGTFQEPILEEELYSDSFEMFFLEWLLREEKLDVAKYRCAAFACVKPRFSCASSQRVRYPKTHVLHGQGCKPA